MGSHSSTQLQPESADLGPFASALVDRLGIKLVKATPQCVVGTMPVQGNTQPSCSCTAGFLALAETLGSVGAMSTLPPTASRLASTSTPPTIAPVGSGSVTGVATPVHSRRPPP
ncbi:hypothetical protein SPURM210S_04331 [Streptomyces purpurascens]